MHIDNYHCGDIKEIAHKNDYDEDIDLVVGGPPCQGFSMANRQRILDDPRNKLYKYYLDLLANVKPKFFIMENVKGMMKKSNEIFYSLTFGSDPIAMAASITTINFLKKNNGLKKINNMGNYFIKNLKNLIKKYNLEKYISIIGFSVKNILIIKGDELIEADLIRNFLIQLLAKNKVLNLGFNIFSVSHNKKITDRLLISYEKSFFELSKQIKISNLKDSKIFKMTIRSARDL